MLVEGSERESGLSSLDYLDLCTRADAHLLSNLSEIHLPGLNLVDVQSGLLIWRRELKFPVNSARPEEGGVQNVDPVCGLDHLQEYYKGHIFGGFKFVHWFNSSNKL